MVYEGTWDAHRTEHDETLDRHRLLEAQPDIYAPGSKGRMVGGVPTT